MATGRRSEQGDAFGVDPEARGVVVDPSDRAFDVPGRLLPARAGGRGKPVIDVEDHIPAASEPSRKQAAAPAALVPPATMDEHDGGMPPAPRTGALWDEPHIQPPHRGGVSAEVGDGLRRRPGMPRQRRDPKPTPPAAVTTKEHSVSTTTAKYSGWLGPGATISSPPARHNGAHPSATQHSSARGRGRGRTAPWAGPRRVRSSSRISPFTSGSSSPGLSRGACYGAGAVTIGDAPQDPPASPRPGSGIPPGISPGVPARCWNRWPAIATPIAPRRRWP
jgi:hypothetical protein